MNTKVNVLVLYILTSSQNSQRRKRVSDGLLSLERSYNRTSPLIIKLQCHETKSATRSPVIEFEIHGIADSCPHFDPSTASKKKCRGGFLEAQSHCGVINPFSGTDKRITDVKVFEQECSLRHASFPDYQTYSPPGLLVIRGSVKKGGVVFTDPLHGQCLYIQRSMPSPSALMKIHGAPCSNLLKEESLPPDYRAH
jgi:hypothetical protein